MSEPASEPVVQVVGRFGDELSADQAADALNRWFRWILDGSAAPVPELFEPLGASTADWAWVLGEDVDWALGPHARVVEHEVRIDLETHDTHLRLGGLLRLLGARSVRFVRDEG